GRAASERKQEKSPGPGCSTRTEHAPRSHRARLRTWPEVTLPPSSTARATTKRAAVGTNTAASASAISRKARMNGSACARTYAASVNRRWDRGKLSHRCQAGAAQGTSNAGRLLQRGTAPRDHSRKDPARNRKAGESAIMEPCGALAGAAPRAPRRELVLAWV